MKPFAFLCVSLMLLMVFTSCSTTLSPEDQKRLTYLANRERLMVQEWKQTVDEVMEKHNQGKLTTTELQVVLERLTNDFQSEQRLIRKEISEIYAKQKEQGTPWYQALASIIGALATGFLGGAVGIKSPGIVELGRRMKRGGTHGDK